MMENRTRGNIIEPQKEPLTRTDLDLRGVSCYVLLCLKKGAAPASESPVFFFILGDCERPQKRKKESKKVSVSGPCTIIKALWF
jgi:hypothetical protein